MIFLIVAYPSPSRIRRGEFTECCTIIESKNGGVERTRTGREGARSLDKIARAKRHSKKTKSCLLRKGKMRADWLVDFLFHHDEFKFGLESIS